MPSSGSSPGMMLGPDEWDAHESLLAGGPNVGAHPSDTPSSSAVSLTSLEPDSAAFGIDLPANPRGRKLDLNSNHLTTSFGALRGASMMQTLITLFAVTAGHSLLDVTRTAGKCSVSGLIVLCAAVPLLIDRSAGMLLEVTEVTRCGTYSDVAYTIAGCAGRALVDWSTVVFQVAQLAACTRLLYQLLPSILAILSGVEITRDSPLMHFGTIVMMAALASLLFPMMRASSLRALRAASAGSGMALALFVASIALHALSLGRHKLQLALELSNDVASNLEYARLVLLWCVAMQGHSTLPMLFAELRRANARDTRELEHKLRSSRFVSKRTKMEWLVRVMLVGCACAFFAVAIASRLAFPAGTALSVLQGLTPNSADAAGTPPPPSANPARPDSSTAALQLAALVCLLLGMPQQGLVAARCLQSAFSTLCAPRCAACVGGCTCCHNCRDRSGRRLTDRRRAAAARRAATRVHAAEAATPGSAGPAHSLAVCALLVAAGGVGLGVPEQYLACVYDVLSGACAALLLFVLPAFLSIVLRRWQHVNTPLRSAVVVHGSRAQRAGSMLRTAEIWAVLFFGVCLLLLAIAAPLYELGVLLPFMDKVNSAFRTATDGARLKLLRSAGALGRATQHRLLLRAA